MRKKVKAWAVINKNSSIHVQKDRSCFSRSFDVYALFIDENDAKTTVGELYDDRGVSVVPCTITFTLPKTRGKK